jgi:guanylate kinase
MRHSPVFIYVQPPTPDALEKRLRARGSETEESIATRLRTAEREAAFFEQHKSIYHAVLVNDDLEETYLQLKEVLRVFGNFAG